MSTPTSLKQVYIDEMKDLWSANDQIQKLLRKILPEASDAKLGTMLSRSCNGIERHISVLKALIAAHGEQVSKDHCKGMEGIVAEATRHIGHRPHKGPLLDLVIIAQYQRMTPYPAPAVRESTAQAPALAISARICAGSVRPTARPTSIAPLLTMIVL